MTAAPPGKPSGRGFWPLRDLPVVMWLVMLLAATVLHPVVPAPRWLMIHLLLLGAVTHAIFVWSTHFTETLLHLSGPSRQRQSVRLALLNVGVITVVGGVLTSRWPVTLLGATGVVGAVAWHGLALASMRHRALPSRFAPVVRYYIAAACFLPVGAGLGAALARDPGEPWHHRLMFAHALVNVLGWMGLTVAGTVVTLWPTMLRTRLDEGAERSARRALPVLVAGVVLAAGASVAGQLQLAAVGLAVYLGGLVTLAVPLCRVTVRRPPSSYATWSVGAAGLWLTGSLLVLVLGIATSSGWPQAAHRFEAVTPLLAAAFGAQVLLGALSHLIPVALGGGPAVTRRTHASMDRGAALRVTGANAGLLVCALPVAEPGAGALFGRGAGLPRSLRAAALPDAAGPSFRAAGRDRRDCRDHPPRGADRRPRGDRPCPRARRGGRRRRPGPFHGRRPRGRLQDRGGPHRPHHDRRGRDTAHEVQPYEHRCTGRRPAGHRRDQP